MRSGRGRSTGFRRSYRISLTGSAGINRVGLTLVQAIGILVNTNLGLLSYEIRRIKCDMDWGVNFTEALIRFEQRISTPSISRTVTLMTKASEMSGQIGEVLAIAASDAKMSETLKKERFAEMFIYTAIVYHLVFGLSLCHCRAHNPVPPGPFPYGNHRVLISRVAFRFGIGAGQDVGSPPLPRVPGTGTLLRPHRRADGGVITFRWSKTFLHSADRHSCHVQISSWGYSTKSRCSF